MSTKNSDMTSDSLRTLENCVEPHLLEMGQKLHNIHFQMLFEADQPLVLVDN